MLTNIRNSYQPAVKEYDLTVFIDVFRASTTLLQIFRAGATEVIGVNDKALITKYVESGYRLISEVFKGGIDNSPSLIADENLNNVKVIQKTGNLTSAIFGNLNFRRAVIGCFNNIDMLAKYIKKEKFICVDIVAASHFDEKIEAIEDLSCAIMLENLLKNIMIKEYPFNDSIRKKIETRRNGLYKFPVHYWKDIEIALERNSIRLIPEVTKINNSEVKFDIINSSFALEK